MCMKPLYIIYVSYFFFFVINGKKQNINDKIIHMSEQKIEKIIYDGIVIGNGPGGCGAAIYIARGNKKVLMFTGIMWGGHLTTTTDVYNYVGYPQINGLQLMENMMEQCEKCGVKIQQETVQQVIFNENNTKVHKIITTEGNIYYSKVIVIATGATHKHLDLARTKEFNNKGIYYCATCDGILFRDDEDPILVVGGGNTALTEALYLSNICKKIILIHRRDTFRGEPFLINEVKKRSNITILWDSEITELHGKDTLTSVTVTNNKTQHKQNIKTRAVFIAIGFSPNTTMFNGTNLELLEGGYIKVNPINYSTNIPNVYAVGDVSDSIYRQAITAAGDGTKAAIDALKILNSSSE